MTATASPSSAAVAALDVSRTTPDGPTCPTLRVVTSASSRPASRSPAPAERRTSELADEVLDPAPDLVADRSHRIDALTSRVVEDPVLVALAGEVGAGVAAAHRDHHV